MPASTHSAPSDAGPARGSVPNSARSFGVGGFDEGNGFRPPPPPPMSATPPRFLIIGAGSRGSSYAQAMATSSNGIVAAVAEPNAFKRKQLGRTFIWGDDPPVAGAEFTSWQEFVIYEEDRRRRIERGETDMPAGVDGAYVCVLDEMHRDVVLALAQLGGLHIMCEKPLATTLSDCTDIYRSLRDNTNEEGDRMLFSIGHVLRYSPHNITLRKLLLEDRVIGDILSIEHTEPVGWWHFTHSYVRGNWRREDTSAPSLLTKSCHDIDVLLWLLCSPPSCADADAAPHLPSTIASSGSLQYFKQSRKPVGAGSATNCLSCPVEESCKYSAKRIYVGNQLKGLGTGNKHWPVNIVLPEIEDYGPIEVETANDVLLAKLSEDYDPQTPASEVASRNWFGRCVFSGDNDVCDDQVVTVTWDEEAAPCSELNGSDILKSSVPQGRGSKTAVFHMVAHSRKQCDRYSTIYGVDGNIYADSFTITVEDFRTGSKTVHHPKVESLGHGGGDNGLARQFVLAVDKVKNHGWTTDRAQKEIVGCTLEEILRSHALVFCAEDARRGKRVLDWDEWWSAEVAPSLRTTGPLSMSPTVQ